MATIEKLPLTSMSITDAQREKLKSLFPEVFTEGGKIDWNKLKLTLGDTIDVGKERFGMNWPGKADCFRTIQQPSIATLEPDREESVDFDTTQNLFIEGDNLEVLKLLQKSYLGKIKMIYIDPPYNTGHDFIYPDDFGENMNTYLEYTGQVDSEGRRFATNADTDGRFHSKWLNMMYPRLFLAKNLLREDGVIFIHIDDNEINNLRMIMNEIFGEENFIECVIWNKRIPKNDKGIGSIHEYILIFVKDSSFEHNFVMNKEGIGDINELLSELKRNNTPIIESEKRIRNLYQKKGYDRGITLYNSLDSTYRLWGKINMSWPNANTFGPRYEIKHPKTNNPVKIPDRGWRWKRETFNDAAGIINGKYQNITELPDGSFTCGRIWFDKDENTQPSSINYLEDLDKLLLRSIISLKSDGGIEVEGLFEGKSYFSYPKPTSLAKLFLGSVKVKNNDIILDFFAGSATSAHAVLELNKEDASTGSAQVGNRKFICVQLPEPTDENSEAFKAGYKTIADISKERIRRVIKKIKEEQATEQKKKSGELSFEEKKEQPQDLGFKVFKLEPSNFKIWNSDMKKEPEVIAQELFEHIRHISPEAKQEAILYELLLKSGFELTTTIEKLSLGGKAVFSIAEGELLICLDKKLTPEIIKAMAERKPTRVICLDEGFQDNDQLKTNAVQIMKSKGVLNFRTV